MAGSLTVFVGFLTIAGGVIGCFPPSSTYT
jgi:hypothetical protein